MSTTTTTLVTSGTPWHPQSFADLSKRLQSEPEAVSHDIDFTFQALAMRSQTQQTTITQINNIINGKGTVSSVALAMPSIFGVAGSPITTSGTLSVTLLSQNANLVWAGPASGPAALPTFRALTAADLSINFADDETVSGSGTAFTLAHTPSPAASLQLFQALPGFGSVLLIAGTGYTLAGASITTTNSLSAGVLRAWYRY